MTSFKRHTLAFVAVACAAALCPPVVQAQTNIEVFGQNRVQYRKFDWKFFDTEHFRIYHYDMAGRTLARYVAEQAEKDINIIERKLGGKFPKRFNIVLYNNYDEYRQTNVGRKYDSQIQDIPAGTVDLVGDRLVVYYTGVHTDLRRQMRGGMSRVVMEHMLFGDSFREMVKNAVLLNLPQWTVDGFIAYLVDGWDAKSDNEWKNLLAAKPGAGFYKLADLRPELAGKAFWKYVAESHGEKEVKNMLYTMQLRSSLSQGIRMSLGMKVQQAYDSCMAFYRDAYAADAQVHETPDDKSALISVNVPADNRVVRTMRVSPKGADIAYVSWKEGEWQVYIQHTRNEQQRSMILQGGNKDFNEVQPDPDYPLLAWSNNGYKLAILYRDGLKTRLRIYNSLKAKIENYIVPPNRFDRVLGMTFMEDDDKLVFSAIKKSQTDLYEFRIKGSRLTNITNDPWDDTQPWYVSGGFRKGILFLSNRPRPNLKVPVEVNELPTGPMNVFFYDTKTKSEELLQCSDVTKGSVSQPIQFGSDNMAYLYDSSGVANQYVVVFGRNALNEDSAYAVPVTNYNSSIISHQYNPASNQVATVVQDADKYQVYFRPLEIPDQDHGIRQPVPARLSAPAKGGNGGMGAKMYDTAPSGPVKEPSAVKQGNTFQTEFKDDTVPGSNTTGTAPAQVQARRDIDTTFLLDPSIKDSTYLKLKSQAYRLSFKPDFFTVRVDNSVLFNRYQSVAYNGGSYSNPSLGGMLTVSLNDALEDHRFTGGLRLPVNFSGLTYFMQYENFKRRVDWGLMYLRTESFYNYLVTYTDSSGRPLLYNEQLGKVTTNILQGNASYALDRRRRIGMQLALRQDLLDFKAEDTLSLTFSPRQKTYWALSRAEYVFDNSISPALNIRQGFRYKFFAEYMLGLNGGNGGMYNFGVDFRHYQKIFKNFIWASRIAAAHSGGKQKILYFMGGVDNWINPKYNDFTPIDANGNFAFQTLATNLRGYKQNARNGNSYAVFNGEARLPIVSTFFKKPVQSGLLKNLQAIGFIDVGSAWDGFLPNADNISKDFQLSNPYVNLQVHVPGSSGLGVGYGAGIRTMIFGYFTRFDAAWNIDGDPKPILYFSFGTDF